MPKETVRYPDALVAGVEAVVAESDAFESKSEFYRFASDFLLTVLDGDHEPTVLGYGDIVADLEATSGARLHPETDAEEPSTGPFLDAYIQVRRHLLYDDVESARAVVADRYDATDREALLLDEIIGRERTTTHPGRPAARAPGPVPREGEDGGESRNDGGRDRDGPPGETADGSTPEGTTGVGRSGDRRGRPAEATRETDGGTDAARDAEDT